jgi:tetratricopeptide (TPR) repeat protein
MYELALAVKSRGLHGKIATLPTAEFMNVRRIILGVLLLAALVGAVYLPGVAVLAGAPVAGVEKRGGEGAGGAGSALLWRDLSRLDDGRSLAEAWKVPAAPMPPSVDRFPIYAPVSSTLLHFESRIWGARRTGYLLASLALHVLTVLLLWQLLQKMGLGNWSLLGAALFAVYPTHVETIAWAAQQGEVLAMALGAGAGLCWMRWTAAAGTRRGAALAYAAALVLAGGAMLAHPVAVICPLGLFLLGWRGDGLPRRNVLGVLPAVAGAVVIAGVNLRMQSQTMALADFLAPAADRRWTLLFQAAGFYLQKLLVPWRLNFLYPKWAVGQAGPSTWVMLVAVLVGLVALFAGRRRITRGPLIAAVWFLAAVACAVFIAGDLRVALVADHLQYFGSIALCGIVAAGLGALVRKWPSLRLAAAGLGCVAVLLLGGLALGRGRLFADREALYRDTLAKNPNSAIAAEELADLLVQRDGARVSAEAGRLYMIAMASAPGLQDPPRALAGMYLAQGRERDAQEMLQKMLLAHPDDPNANETLADLVVRSIGTTAYPKVRVYYERAFAAAPERTAVARKLAAVYLSEHRLSDCQRVLEKSLAIHPKEGGLHLELAKVFALEQKYPEANREYDIATAFDSSDPETFCNWGLMLIDAHQPERAEQHFREALRIDPHNAKYQLHLGRALRDQGRLSLAVAAFEKASTLDEHLAAAYIEAGNTYQMIQKDAEAEVNFRAAIHIDPHSVEGTVRLAQLLLNARDPARQTRENLFEGITLMQKAVEESHGGDLNLLVQYAAALARGEAYDQALDYINRALVLATRTSLPGDQREVLLQRKQSYELALMPPLPTSVGESRITLVGTGREVPDEQTMPEAPQPHLREVIAHPLDYSRPPSSESMSVAAPEDDTSLASPVAPHLRGTAPLSTGQAP